METFPGAVVTSAFGDAFRLGAPGFDDVKQLVIARAEHRPLPGHQDARQLRLHGDLGPQQDAGAETGVL